MNFSYPKSVWAWCFTFVILALGGRNSSRPAQSSQQNLFKYIRACVYYIYVLHMSSRVFRNMKVWIITSLYPFSPLHNRTQQLDFLTGRTLTQIKKKKVSKNETDPGLENISLEIHALWVQKALSTLPDNITRNWRFTVALLKVKHFLQDVLVGLVPLQCSNLNRCLNKDGLTNTERNGTSTEIASTPGQAKGHQQAIWLVEIKENYSSQLVRNNTETQGS